MAKDLAIDVGIPVDTDEFDSFVACVDNILTHGCGYADEVTDRIVEKCHTSELPIAKKVLRECRRIARNASGIRPSKSKWWETYYNKKNSDVPRWPGRKPDHEKRPMSPLFEKRKRPKRKRPMSPMFENRKRPMSPMFENRKRGGWRKYDRRDDRRDDRNYDRRDERRNYDRRDERRNYDRRNYGDDIQYERSSSYETNSKKRKYR